MRFFLMVALFVVFFSESVFANDTLQLDLMNKPFPAQKIAVLQAINKDVDYVEITTEKRTEVSVALDSIDSLLGHGKSFSSLDASIQKQALDKQSRINDALVQARKDSRLVCSKESTLGSNIPKRVCRTAAARRRWYDALQDELIKRKKPIPPPNLD